MITSTETTVGALVIPATVQNAVVPKPTKAEIIHALAVKKHEQLKIAAKESEEKRERLEAEAKAAVIEFVKAHPELVVKNMDARLGSYRHENYNDKSSPKIISGVSIYADIDNLPAALKRKLIAYHNARDERTIAPDFLEVKRQIRDAMTGQLSNSTDRMQKMLSDPKVSRALDQILAHMDKSAAKI